MNNRKLRIVVRLALAAPLWGCAATPFTMSLQVRAAGAVGPGGTERAISPDETLHTGDRLALNVGVDQAAYVYVLYQAPDGKSAVLYPRARDERVGPGRPLRVPAAGHWLALDDTKGTEQIYIVASRRPLGEADPSFCRTFRLPSCLTGKGDPPPPPPPQPGTTIQAKGLARTQRDLVMHVRSAAGDIALVPFTVRHEQ